MAVPSSAFSLEADAQDLAEVFDETHLDEDEGDFALPEEMTDVFDATRIQARPLPSRLSPHLHDDTLSRHALEARAEEWLSSRLCGPLPACEEIELVYVGLLRNQRGAQASAAHWEARHLSDQDIRKLGYGTRRPVPRQHQ